MIKVSPSILAADFSNLIKDVNDVKNGGADYLHFDVMDGLFVPNISIGIPVLKSLRKATDMFLDVHLMIDRPHRYVKEFCDAGADLVVFPEKEAGIRIANNLFGNNLLDAIELSSTFSMAEITVPEEWVGRSLIDLNLRAKRKLNVIGIRRMDHLNINPDAAEPLKAEDVLIMIGKNEELKKLGEGKK